MKHTVKILLLYILIFFPIQTLSQNNDQFQRLKEYSTPERLYRQISSKLSEGIYTVGSGGYFSNLDTAFRKLSIDGIEGEVTLELIDELYVAPSDTFGFLLDGPITGTGPDKFVILKPAINKNVTIQGSGEAVFNFRNVSYLKVDGVELNGSTTLKIHSLQNQNCCWNDGIVFMNNSKHNVVQNVTIECDDYTRLGDGIVLIHLGGNFSPDSNLIQNNIIKKAAIGINVVSFQYRVTGNIIRNNRIGSEVDGFISMGINVTFGQSTLIEQNTIRHLRSNSNKLISYSGIASLAGVGDIIRDNVIFDVSIDRGTYGGIGIILNGTTFYKGCSNLVYNNMVYNIQCTSQDQYSKVCGIEVRNQDYPKIFFNSILLSGSGANQKGSAGLFIDINCSNIDIKNNIFVNERDEFPFNSYAIYNHSSSIINSDYNDLFVIQNDNNYIVQSLGMNYKKLIDWQDAGHDANSSDTRPRFINPDLHIDPRFPENAFLRGIPISGINFDIDKQLRDQNNPNIGADEFDVSNEVEYSNQSNPIGFKLEQNYPNPFNPTTTIRYQLSDYITVSLKVYDIAGNEIATLINEEQDEGIKEITFDGSSFASGIYFYRLQAGNNISTKKMMLVK